MALRGLRGALRGLPTVTRRCLGEAPGCLEGPDRVDWARPRRHRRPR